MYINSLFRELFVILYMCASMGAFAVLFVPESSDLSAVGSTPLFMAAWSVLYGGTILMCMHWLPRFKIVYLISLLPAIYFIFSSIWSLQPSKTVLYSVAFLLNMIFVVFLYANYRMESFFVLFLKSLILMVACSILLSLLGVDSVRYNDVHGRMNFLGYEPVRGLFNHKITAGVYSVLGFVIAVYTLSGMRRISVCLMFAMFILMSGSATALSMLVLSVGIIYFIGVLVRARVSPNIFIVSLVFTVLVSILMAVHYLPYLLDLLGRDPTLTGRTVLWSWALEVIEDKPFMGWGYLSYNGSNVAGIVSDSYREFENYSVPHFHNSYLQVWVEGGVMLLLPFLFMILIALRNYYSGEYYGINFSVLPLAILMVVLVEGVFVNLMFKYNDFNSMLVMLVITYSFDMRGRWESARNV